MFGCADYSDQTEKWFGELADRGSSVTISFRFVERIVSNDLASERGIFQIGLKRADGDERTFYGRFHTSAHRTDGRWRICVDYDTDERSATLEEESLAATTRGVLRGVMPSGVVLNYARPQMDTTTSRRVPLVMGIAVLVLLLDQATKYWAESALTGRAPIPVLGEFLQLRLLYNPGAAFSIGAGSTWVFTIVAAVAAVLLARYGLQPQTKLRAAALALMLGGATTHLLDRLFRPPGFARGHVVDFIDYNGWFVGNVADIALVCGAILLVLLSFQPAKQPAE